jgi:hypothetical protein
MRTSLTYGFAYVTVIYLTLADSSASMQLVHKTSNYRCQPKSRWTKLGAGASKCERYKSNMKNVVYVSHVTDCVKESMQLFVLNIETT